MVSEANFKAQLTIWIEDHLESLNLKITIYIIKLDKKFRILGRLYLMLEKVLRIDLNSLEFYIKNFKTNCQNFQFFIKIGTQNNFHSFPLFSFHSCKSKWNKKHKIYEVEGAQLHFFSFASNST